MRSLYLKSSFVSPSVFTLCCEFELLTKKLNQDEQKSNQKLIKTILHLKFFYCRLEFKKYVLLLPGGFIFLKNSYLIFFSFF